MLHQRHDARLTDIEAQDLQLLEHIAASWSSVLGNYKQSQVERREGFGDADGQRR